MENREKILELFEEQKDFTDKKVADGIEKYRKGDAKITITSGGKAIANAKVKVKQISHEFKFGANLFMLDELETEEKNALYKKHFSDIFNMATLPFYWDATEPEKGKTRYAKDSEKLYRRPPIDLCIEFCEKYGIEPREHALAYEHFFPNWLRGKRVSEVKEALENRYKEISERYREKIPTIEVTNEMLWHEGQTAFYDSPDYVEWCFRTAEKYFPDNQLVINDYTPLGWEDRCRTTDNYYSYIKANMLSGARIDAIGMQFHMFYKKEEEYQNTRSYYNPKSLYKHMDLYATLDKPLQITEVTIPAYSYDKKDEEIQAKIIEKLYSLWFSHPNVEQIIYWNLVDGYAAFAPQGDMTSGENYYYGGLLRFDMTPKPSYHTIKDLIQTKWHTEKELSTDSDGKTTFRGFYGSYNVEILKDGKTVSKEITLSSKQANNFSIEMPNGNETN